MVLPPVAAIRDLLVIWGSKGLREISRPRWGPEMAVLAANRRHRGVLGIFLAHRNHVRIAQLSYIDDVGWCLPIFPAIRDLLFFGGSWGQRNFAAPWGAQNGRFGRNSAPPGIFGKIFSSSEPRSRRATFVQPRLPMGWPPAAAIAIYWFLGVWGT